MNVGIILAAGKGKRFASKDFNKTTQQFFRKPLVKYGTDLFLETCDKIFVVVGYYSEEVIKSVGKNSKICFVLQKKRLGTGHAVDVAFKEILKRGWKPKKIFVGYGDHMMFYTPEIINKLSCELDRKKGVMSMVTCDYKDPNLLKWGRVVRDKTGGVLAIVEQKDATSKQRLIKELNAGLYCFNYDFLRHALPRIEKTPVSGEYYLTDVIKIATNDKKRVVAVRVPFKYAGIGINTRKELVESKKLFRKVNRK
jgi:bifunctional UDP-N-acetylglucosamine pyrophosphorylase/glucosamine-1-phosphate N-acetyltransferase